MQAVESPRLEKDLTPCLSQAEAIKLLHSPAVDNPTQDSLPAAGQALPDGIGYPQGCYERFLMVSSSFHELGLAQGHYWIRNEHKDFLLEINEVARGVRCFRGSAGSRNDGDVD